MNKREQGCTPTPCSSVCSDLITVEKTVEDIQRAESSKELIKEMMRENDRTWSDPYTLNYHLRKKLRVTAY